MVVQEYKNQQKYGGNNYIRGENRSGDTWKIEAVEVVQCNDNGVLGAAIMATVAT